MKCSNLSSFIFLLVITYPEAIGMLPFPQFWAIIVIIIANELIYKKKYLKKFNSSHL